MPRVSRPPRELLRHDRDRRRSSSLPPVLGRLLHRFTEPISHDCTSRDCDHAREIVGAPADADVVSSLLDGQGDTPDDTYLHAPVIDLDIPCRLVASGTPGHHHLYVDRAIPWKQYVAILDALAAAGLVEQGYVAASVRRGFSSVRVPWKPKGVAA